MPSINKVGRWNGSAWEVYDIAADADIAQEFVKKDGTTAMTNSLQIERPNSSTNSRAIRLKEPIEQQGQTYAVIQSDLSISTINADNKEMTGALHLGYTKNSTDYSGAGAVQERTAKTTLYNEEDGFKIRKYIGTGRYTITIPYNKTGEVLTSTDINTKIVGNPYQEGNNENRHKIQFGTSTVAAAIHFQDKDGNETTAFAEHTDSNGKIDRAFIRVTDSSSTATTPPVFAYRFPYKMPVGTSNGSNVVVEQDLTNYVQKTDLNTLDQITFNAAANDVTNSQIFLKYASRPDGSSTYTPASASIRTVTGDKGTAIDHGLFIQGTVNKTDTLYMNGCVMLVKDSRTEGYNHECWHFSPHDQANDSTSKGTNLGHKNRMWRTLYCKHFYSEDIYNALNTASDFTTFKNTIKAKMEQYMDIQS